jgi:hypothetical protein
VVEKIGWSASRVVALAAPADSTNSGMASRASAGWRQKPTLEEPNFELDGVMRVAMLISLPVGFIS